MRLNIDNSAVVQHTNRLEKMHRSALPSAIRGSLNKAAFDVKGNEMLKSSDQFVKRRPTFFKAKSKVERASGWDTKRMTATVGFVGREQAVEDLEFQEYGGKIKGRAFIPTNKARGGNSRKNVRPSNRIGRINNLVDSKKSKGKPAQQFIRAAIHAGKGGYVIGNKKKRMVLKINSIKRRGNRTFVRSTALYEYEKGRSVKVSQTKFMRTASMKSGAKLNRFYIEEAKRQYNRLR